MYSIVVWLNEDTPFPSTIGPYEDDKVFEDAKLLRDVCHKVNVCNLSSPEKVDALYFLNRKKEGISS